MPQQLPRIWSMIMDIINCIATERRKNCPLYFTKFTIHILADCKNYNIKIRKISQNRSDKHKAQQLMTTADTNIHDWPQIKG